MNDTNPDAEVFEAFNTPDEKVRYSEKDIVETINKSDLIPMYDLNHQHEWEIDPTDEEEMYYAEQCVVKGCNLARLIAKD